MAGRDSEAIYACAHVILHTFQANTHTHTYTLTTFGIHNRLTIEDTIYFGFTPRLAFIDGPRFEGKEWRGLSILRCGTEVHALVGAGVKRMIQVRILKNYFCVVRLQMKSWEKFTLRSCPIQR